jgi:hypothetical protein
MDRRNCFLHGNLWRNADSKLLQHFQNVVPCRLAKNADDLGSGEVLCSVLRYVRFNLWFGLYDDHVSLLNRALLPLPRGERTKEL